MAVSCSYLYIKPPPNSPSWALMLDIYPQIALHGPIRPAQAHTCNTNRVYGRTIRIGRRPILIYRRREACSKGGTAPSLVNNYQIHPSAGFILF